MDPNPYQAPQYGQEREPAQPLIDFNQPETISFELTVDDYVTFNVAHRMNSLLHKWVRNVVHGMGWISVPIGVAAYFAGLLPIVKPNLPPVETRGFLIIWAVGHVVLYPLLRHFLGNRTHSLLLSSLFRMMLARRDNSGLFGHHELTISPAKLHERAPKSEVSHDITAVTRMMLTDELFVIYVSSMHGYLVPRRAFASPEDFFVFLKKMEKWTGLSAKP